MRKNIIIEIEQTAKKDLNDYDNPFFYVFDAFLDKMSAEGYKVMFWEEQDAGN